MRTMWTGAISFGLVNIPIRLYKASGATGIDFDMLHKTDLSPVRYARVCRQEGREIPYEEIVKGYEYSKGMYVVIDDEDFKRANARKTSTIDIVGFSMENEVDTVLFEKPYYMEPDRGADKPYAILREALSRSKKVGIAKYVLRNRERMAIVKPEDSVLVLNQMRFASEMRDASQLNLPPGETASDEEIEMALALIDRLTQPFDPVKYHDTYTEELRAVIGEKAKGKVIPIKGKAPEPTEVKDLMAALKASLEEAERQRAG
ncbi:MAG: non-homologous end joining protein Ku [Candidatus Aquicultorales bacterium]